MFKSLWRLPRNIWLIGLISLCNDGASEMLYPIIPLYLSSVLMAGPRALGVIEGIAEAASSLLKLFSGVVMDRTRRAKPWIVLGYSLAGFGRPLIAFASSWGWVLCIRFADRVGKGLRASPRDALLASSVAPEQRGLAFGLHRAMDNAGAVIGPLAAFALLAWGVPLKDVFLWATLPALACLGLALSLRDREPAPQRAPQRAFDWRLRGMPRIFKTYLAVVALFTLGNSSNMFLLLRAGELGVPTEQVPLLWAAVSAVAMLSSVPLSALSDRLGRTPLLLVGYIAYGVFYLGMGWISGHGAALVLLFGAYGFFMGATEGVEKAFVADLVPEGQRGTAFGWFNLTTGIVLLPASILFGLLYQSISPGSAFLFSCCCSLLAAVLLKLLVMPAFTNK
ncbi:MAG: MFS transporter [Deltaproteobacteria bacterium]|jgi:MFS family permease|nr:MFS transporter [Deltaproteobacteria bacterium]